jgi:hypothetical protein
VRTAFEGRAAADRRPNASIGQLARVLAFAHRSYPGLLVDLYRWFRTMSQEEPGQARAEVVALATAATAVIEGMVLQEEAARWDETAVALARQLEELASDADGEFDGKGAGHVGTLEA